MKFNQIFRKQNVVKQNYEGATAYTISKEMELYSTVVTTSLENTNYENPANRYDRIKTLVAQCNPVFVAKLAVYARNKMNLRSIPVVLAVELGKIHSGDDLVSKTIYNIIQRADEITEVLAYYQMANQRNDVKKLNKLSKQIQKGIAMSFSKFDEYQFAKYNRNTEVSLKDALFLTHPKANSEDQQSLFRKIINNELAVPYTWEVELSVLGHQKFENEIKRKEAVKAKWEQLIDSRKIGYMALMRNLRNILQAEVSASHIQKVFDYLTNELAILNAKQLPFRYLSAYRELMNVQSSYTSYMLEALEIAVKISAQNIKGFDLSTQVVIASDVSGSMYKTISPKSTVMLYDVGLMLSMLLQSRSKNTITGIFGDSWMTYALPKDGVLRNVNELKRIEGKVGYSTNGYKVIQYLNNNRKSVDKVMIFTDLQLWNSNQNDAHIQKEWNKYRSTVNPNAKLYLFDLAGYGNTPLKIEQNNVYLIAGWSDKVFEVLNALENDKKALSEINKIEI